MISAAMGKFPERKSHAALPPDDGIWDILERCWVTDVEARISLDELYQAVSFSLFYVEGTGTDISQSESWRGR